MSGLRQEWKVRASVGERIAVHFNGLVYEGTVVDRNLEQTANACIVIRDEDGVNEYVIPAFTHSAVLSSERKAQEDPKKTDVDKKPKDKEPTGDKEPEKE